MRSVLERAGLLGFGLLVGVLLAEAMCALLRPSSIVSMDILGRSMRSGPVPEYQMAEAEGQVFHSFKPAQQGRTSLLHSYAYSWSINDLGLRSGPLPPKKTAFRILVLGDSQTFGYAESDKTYPGRLAVLLKQRSGKDVEVVNGAVPGYATLESYWQLERVGKAVAPDLVILTYHGSNNLVPDEGNDTYQNSVRFAQPAAGERAPTVQLRPEGERAVGWARSWLSHHSHLYAVLAQMKTRVLGGKGHFDLVRDYVDDGQLAVVWQKTRSVLEAVRQYSESHLAAKVLLVYMPDLPALAGKDRSVEQELSKSGLPLVSVFGVLERGMEGEPWKLRTRLDAHYNDYALDLIGREVARFVFERWGSEF